ncbi:nucleoporin [Trypanosoma grayi]|uniref:nucleoporin n=1 Tax=Trypanosoma grayi TaxID=71804 RepID=UPI0004F44F8C|nr:nucleoporin [Trypanosoma grayi]KEG15119.1 nucleoporin [Trypanosoma grayi]
MPFLNLPDFADKPYGNVLLFAPDEQPKRPPAAVPPATAATATIIPTSLSQYQQRMRAGTQAPNANVSLKQQPASFSVSGLSPEALRELISSPKVKLGVPDVTSDAVPPSPARALLGGSVVSTPDAAPHAPICTSSDYILDPPLRVLQEFTVQQLQGVHDFSVYRRDGKCSVRFLEPVNLVRCDVSDVLALRQNGEVKFYPDTAVPPPLGNGLHVRARVTVNGVVGMTAAELRERCHKEGIIFDSYDTTTGTWVYTANVDDGDLADEDGYLPEIERLSTYGESLDGVVYTPAPLDTSGWSQRATPVPPPPALHTKALPPASLARVSSRPDQSSVLPVRTHEVSVRGQVAHYDVSNETPAATDFELPYDLPDIHEAAPRERKGVLVMKEPHAETYAPVYVVEKERSKMYEVNASIVSQSTMAGLARSFRCGWLVGGCLAAPTFAWLRDGTEGKQVVEEVRGANVIVANPFFAHASRDHYLQSCAISVLRTVCRYLHLVEGTANHSDHFSLAAVNLSRQDSSVSLSKEKLRELVVAIDAVRSERVSEMEASTTRQAKTVLNLLDALYGLPEADKAESNAIAETRYLTQLRRRNLNAWLKGELSFMDTWAQEKLEMNATQQLLCKLLCRNLREAVPIAKAAGGAELSRVLGICGDGNQFGSYVKTADTDRLDADVNVRDRVVSLLSGIVEPFIAHPVYVRSRDGAAVAVVPLTATWKQLLGIFAFYGCTPDTSAEDIIDAFLERLRAPASRQENAFPPYADRIPQDMLNTARGQDFLARGDEFQDAALSILEGFAKGLAPASSALHPHASSYCATDYLTPFLILVAVRALKLQRTVAYRDAETKVLLGFTAALECLTESWFWALLPLHMIEDTICRKLAVESHLRRNAYRFKNSTCSSNADYKHIMELLKVDVLLLEPERPPEEARLEAPPNAPSIRTHTSLQDALSRFSRGFSTQ